MKLVCVDAEGESEELDEVTAGVFFDVARAFWVAFWVASFNDPCWTVER